MREILFRGKLTDNGVWVYGDYVKAIKFDNSIAKHCIVENKSNWDLEKNTSAQEVYGVDSKTVGQFTGLYDKNGKKIFEGDKCRNTETGEIVFVVWHGTMAGYVWSRLKEGYKHLFDFGALFRCFDKWEVIGNIHDNPELLMSDE